MGKSYGRDGEWTARAEAFSKNSGLNGEWEAVDKDVCRNVWGARRDARRVLELLCYVRHVLVSQVLSSNGVVVTSASCALRPLDVA